MEVEQAEEHEGLAGVRACGVETSGAAERHLCHYGSDEVGREICLSVERYCADAGREGREAADGERVSGLEKRYIIDRPT